MVHWKHVNSFRSVCLGACFPKKIWTVNTNQQLLCNHLVVTLTHSAIQNGCTALQQASRKGHQKVVELLLGAGANPDLQNKVRTGWDSA